MTKISTYIAHKWLLCHIKYVVHIVNKTSREKDVQVR